VLDSGGEDGNNFFKGWVEAQVIEQEISVSARSRRLINAPKGSVDKACVTFFLLVSNKKVGYAYI
jgi:hypothetical protein